MIATVASVMVACKSGEKKAETTDSTATSTPVAPTTEAAPAPTTEAAPAPTTEAAPAPTKETTPAATTTAPADASKDKMQAEAPAAEKKMESTPKK